MFSTSTCAVYTCTLRSNKDTVIRRNLFFTKHVSLLKVAETFVKYLRRRTPVQILLHNH